MKKKFINATTAGLIALGGYAVCLGSSAEDVGKPFEANKEMTTPSGMVKCYGVAMAGKNSCNAASGKHACAGRSTVDNDPCEWKAMTKEDCKMKGGTETPVNCLAAKMMDKVVDKEQMKKDKSKDKKSS